MLQAQYASAAAEPALHAGVVMGKPMGRPRGVTLPGLRDARRRRFLTQAQLSAAAEVSIHVINRAENGERASVTTAAKLAQALRVRPEQLLAEPKPEERV